MGAVNNIPPEDTTKIVPAASCNDGAAPPIDFSSVFFHIYTTVQYRAVFVPSQPGAGVFGPYGLYNNNKNLRASRVEAALSIM